MYLFSPSMSLYLQKSEAAKPIGGFGVLRISLAAISIAVCVTLAGGASGAPLEDKGGCVKCGSWQSLGNNGGKVDRYALGRAAASQSSVAQPDRYAQGRAAAAQSSVAKP
jgi:hypothetical protein